MTAKQVKLPLFVLILVVGIFIGFEFKDLVLKRKMDTGQKKIEQIINLIEDYYVDPVKKDELVESAINGILEKLDPHSVYISKEEQKSENEELEGGFEGIGVEFQIINDTINIISSIAGGPSEAIGITAGDRLIKINGLSAVGYSNQDVFRKLKGPKGSKVKISIYRPSIQKELDFEIIRDKIPIYSVTTAMMYDDSVAYVNLSRFAETTESELIEALDKLKKAEMKYLILDLRNNPGGLLSQASNVSDLFIDEKKIIVYTKGKLPDFNEEYFAFKNYDYEKIPMIVLVNRGSASASEIVAGAIQDWDRGLIVGETTFGKGLVQRAVMLGDSSAIRITIAKYFTPAGREIQRKYKNNSNYYNEVIERTESEQNNLNLDLSDDSSKSFVKTKGGRVIKTGGGITPDYIIPSGLISDYTAELRAKNLFYLFISDYLDKKRENFKKIYSNNMKLFKSDIKLSSELFEKFRAFISGKDLKFSSKDMDNDRMYVVALLKAYIARDLWRDDGWYYIMLDVDAQFEKAINLLPETADLFSKNYQSR